MDKIAFLEFEKIMSCDLTRKEDPCIEICFEVSSCMEYQEAWMGKIIDRETKHDVYWFGLVPDGSQAYDFESFEEFANAKVFYGSKSLKEIWNSISFILTLW